MKPRILFLNDGSVLVRYGLMRGFERAGCQVRGVQDANYTKDGILEVIREFRPDYLFANGGIEPLDRDLVKSVTAESGIPLIFWAIEDPTYDDAPLDFADVARLILTPDAESLDRLYRPREIRAVCVPAGCDPDFHRIGVRDSALASVAAFVGNNYSDHPYRLAGYRVIFDPLLAIGLEIQFWGNEWWVDPGYTWCPPRCLYRGYLSPMRIPDLCASVDVILGVHSVGTSSTMPAMRTFEILGCEGFYLAHWSPGVEAMFGPNHRYLVWSKTPEETLEHWRFYRSRPGLCREIARRGREHVLVHHNYQRRAEAILEALQC